MTDCQCLHCRIEPDRVLFHPVSDDDNATLVKAVPPNYRPLWPHIKCRCPNLAKTPDGQLWCCQVVDFKAGMS